MAFQCLATFNKTHKWDQGPKCFSVLSETTAKSRCLQTSKNRVSIYNILPPQITLCLVFSLKISWAGQLRTSGGFFFLHLLVQPPPESTNWAVPKCCDKVPRAWKYATASKVFRTLLLSGKPQHSLFSPPAPAAREAAAPLVTCPFGHVTGCCDTLMARRAGGPEMCKWPKRTSCLQRGKKNSRTT